MKVLSIVALAFLAEACLASPVPDPFFASRVEMIGKLFNDIADLTHEAISKAAEIANEAAEKGTGMAGAVSTYGTGFAKSSVDKAAGLGHKALGVVESVADVVALRRPVTLATGFGKMTINTANSAAQGGLKLADDLSQSALSAAKEGVNSATHMAQTFSGRVNTGFKDTNSAATAWVSGAINTAGESMEKIGESMAQTDITKVISGALGGSAAATQAPPAPSS